MNLTNSKRKQKIHYAMYLFNQNKVSVESVAPVTLLRNIRGFQKW